MFKVTYNAPVTLTFVILCFLVTMFVAEPFKNWVIMPDYFKWASLQDWVSSVTYVFKHADVQSHLVGNMLLILLVGPMLEEKFGSGQILTMILITAVATALFNAFFLHQSIIGASGIVFMMIMLGSLTNFQRGQIPLTFLFVAFLFIGKELLGALKDDEVSQYAHIAGGVIGSIFGFMLVRSKSPEATSAGDAIGI